MRRRRLARPGEGTAWLVSDGVTDGYLCYWYAGTDDCELRESARVESAVDAVMWGRQRTPRVRIRTDEARTYWAGTQSAPVGFTHLWIDRESASDVATPSEAPAPDTSDRTISGVSMLAGVPC